MAFRQVHWQEGLFLRPHHFQAADRHTAEQVARAAWLNSGYPCGISTIELDLDALSNHNFYLKTLKALLPDGSLISIPGDDGPLSLNFKELLDKEGNVTVLIGLPLLSLGRPNVQAAGNDPLTRAVLETVTVEDENDGQRPEAIQLRKPTLRLLTQADKTDGMAVLTLARVNRSTKSDGAPQLDPDFFPPLFFCNSFPPLGDGLVAMLMNRIGRKISGVAGQLNAGGLGLGAREPLLLGQLSALNRSQAALRGVVGDRGATTSSAYIELCRVVGDLALFGESRILPELPDFHHLEPHRSFLPLRRQIEEYLDRVVEPEYKERPFIGAGLRMQVTLESAWMEPTWGMFIGVESDLTKEEVVRIITQPGVLDMKVGSSEQVDGIFRAGKAGLRFNPINNPPRVLPPGVTYFQLARDVASPEWDEVRKTLGLAIRFNETKVQGSIQDQQVLTLSVTGKTCKIQFTLYVVSPKSMV